MKLFSKNKKAEVSVQTAPKPAAEGLSLSLLTGSNDTEDSLYKSLRDSVPVIDAALGKIVRLIGSFEVKVGDRRFEEELKRFCSRVRVSGGTTGIQNFIYVYLLELLTFGRAVGEMLVSPDLKGVEGLYNASVSDVSIKLSDDPTKLLVCSKGVEEKAFENQELILCSLLSPTPATAQGNSILKGLPFVSSVLMKIFSAISQNWDRAGNIRYAVTYKPQSNTGVNATLRAKEIANEWSRAMRDEGGVCDFVSVGDVSVKVIGADSQILDCDIPVKHLLEQIVSKLCIPPFLLGLSWSSTERMSSVQSDILTSELEYYRSVLTPVIVKICSTHLRLSGCRETPEVCWSNISLQDEEKLSHARLMNAQAQAIEDNREVSD